MGFVLWRAICSFNHFYSRDAIHSAVIATATCPSDSLSVTAGIVSSRAKAGSWNVHHVIAPWFHFLARYDSSKNSQGITQRNVPIESECRHVSKTMHFRHKVTMERIETICKLSNCVTFDALEWPMTRISTASRGFVSDSWAFLLISPVNVPRPQLASMHSRNQRSELGIKPSDFN